jgi:hypothetical protein
VGLIFDASAPTLCSAIVPSAAAADSIFARLIATTAALDIADTLSAAAAAEDEETMAIGGAFVGCERFRRRSEGGGMTAAETAGSSGRGFGSGANERADDGALDEAGEAYSVEGTFEDDGLEDDGHAANCSTGAAAAGVRTTALLDVMPLEEADVAAAVADEECALPAAAADALACASCMIYSSDAGMSARMLAT